jgi:hypothetical protein
MQNLGGSYSYLTTATMWGVMTVVINFAMVVLFSRSHIPMAGLLECVELQSMTIGLMNGAMQRFTLGIPLYHQANTCSHDVALL